MLYTLMEARGGPKLTTYETFREMNGHHPDRYRSVLLSVPAPADGKIPSLERAIDRAHEQLVGDKATLPEKPELANVWVNSH
jgi:hypothetical protein